jgi:hypothetical protein
MKKKRLPQCPFFREPCLKEGCSAYSKGRRFSHSEYDGDGEVLVYKGISHCNVFKIDLPFGWTKDI